MRWLFRVFASAIVRRVAYAVAAALLLSFGANRASAAVFADEGAAYSACMAAAAGHPGMYNGRPVTTHCPRLGDYAQFTCYGYSANGAQIIGCMGQDSVYSWPLANSCEKRPDWNGAYPYLSGGKPKNGSVTCNAGCKQAWYSTGDGYFNGKYTSTPGTCNEYDDQKCKADFGSGYYFNHGMSSCEPEGDKCPGGKPANSLGQCDSEPCPSGMAQQADGTCKKKSEECPAGQIRSPLGNCIPGDNQCAAGEVRGKDGTCKRDRDGDGNPDEGEEEGEGPDGEKVKENFSGGDDCNAPPSCSGSPIMCGQARIQWRIDCNTRKNRNIAGGTCSTPPICTGEKCDSMEYSGLLFQWRSACAAEKLLAKSGDSTGGSSGDANSNGVADVLEGKGAVNAPGDGKADVAGVKKWGINLSTSVLDTSDMLGGGSCPQPPTIVIMGKSVSGADVPYFCQLAAILRGLILFFGAYMALRILMGGSI